MASKKSNTTTELVQVKENTALISSMDELPDYLKEQSRSEGLEDLDKNDFKRPRLILLQPLSPQVKTYAGKAIPGQFWHTGANVSLGSEFKGIMLKANKRVILWKPRWDGGGMLAFSPNGKDWVMGGNQEFTVRPSKDSKSTTVWKTGKDVLSSKLLDWGSSNPSEPDSQPAASLVYEYLFYLIDRPDLSPVVLGCYKTAITNAKQFNTNLMGLRRPTTAIGVRVFAEEKSGDGGEWHVPAFETIGWVNAALFKTATEMRNMFADYEVEYSQEDEEVTVGSDDAVPY